YRNFHRTIIIPQGKFQEFLQLGESERTKMLKEIFQLEKYEFYQQTSLLDKENSDQLHFLKGQMLQHEHVTSEAIQTGEELLLNLNAEWEKSKTGLDILEKKCAEWTDLKKMLDLLTVYQNQVETLLLKESHFLQIDNQIRTYEYCIREFKSDLQYRTALNR